MNLAGRLRSSFEVWYLPFILWLACLAPGLRRIVDWQFGRNPLSILSVLPLFSLIPLAFVVYRNASAPGLRLPFKGIAYFWLFGFIYALFVALSSGGKAAALYDFAQFSVPLLVGLWMIVRPIPRAESFKQLSSTVLWLAAFESLYGIYQFVAPPPWDVEYVNTLGQGSLGIPEPFGLHAFAMLNSAAPLGMFLAVSILLNLHKLDLRRPIPLIIISFSILAMMLTTVRSSWLALAVGVTVYLVLSPKRGKALFALGAVGALALVLILNASTLLGNSEVTSSLQDRFSTLGNVSEDASVNDRREQTSYALHQGLAEPLGQGLGTVGTATWLAEGQDDSKVSSLILDDGYIARFLEMGIPGSLCYIATLILGAAFGLRAFIVSLTTRNVALQQIAVAGLAVQAALIGLDLSGDYHSALAGDFFWLVIGLSLRHEAGDETLHREFEAPLPAASNSRRPRWA